MATAKFYLNHPRKKGTKELRTDEVPIDLMFSLDRDTRLPVTTGERIIPKYWNFKSQEAKSNYKDYLELNDHLKDLKTKVLNIWRTNKSLTWDELKKLIKQAVKGEEEEKETSVIQKKTVIECVKLFIAQYAQDNDPSSVSKYKALLKRLIEYDEFSKAKIEAAEPNPPVELTFENLNGNFYDCFRNYLYNLPAKLKLDDNGAIIIDRHGRRKIEFPNPTYSYHKLVKQEKNVYHVVKADDFDVNKDTPVPLMDETVFKYFVNFKTALEWIADRYKDIQVNPDFKKWKILRKEYEPIPLTRQELRRLETTSMPDAETDYGADVLILESRTGQRVSDWKKIDEHQVVGNIWRFTQQKGNRTLSKRIALPLEGFARPAYLIMQKYNFKLKQYADQTVNRYIKKACREAGIDSYTEIERWAGNKKLIISGPKWEFISTHTGRKTFVTIALQSKKMSVSMVMEITGIRSFKTLNHYKGLNDPELIIEGLEDIEEGNGIMRKTS